MLSLTKGCQHFWSLKRIRPPHLCCDTLSLLPPLSLQASACDMPPVAHPISPPPGTPPLTSPVLLPARRDQLQALATAPAPADHHALQVQDIRVIQSQYGNPGSEVGKYCYSPGYIGSTAQGRLSGRTLLTCQKTFEKQHKRDLRCSGLSQSAL